MKSNQVSSLHNIKTENDVEIQVTSSSTTSEKGRTPYRYKITGSRVRQFRWGSPTRVEHFTKLVDDRKKMLFGKKKINANKNEANMGDTEQRSVMKASRAWRRIASELNKANREMNVSWIQCKNRFTYMKKMYVETHTPPSTGTKKGRVAPWPYSERFRSIMKYYTSVYAVTGDEAKLKEMLDGDPEHADEEQEENAALNESNNNDVSRGEDGCSDEDSDLSEEDEKLENSNSRITRWSDDATWLFLKLMKDQKEILFARKPEDRERYAFGYARRRRAWRRISIELNKALGMRVTSKRCKVRFEYLRTIFVDLTRPIKERLERRNGRTRKMMWPFFYQFLPLMKYICEENPASADDRMKRVLQRAAEQDAEEERVTDTEDSAESDADGDTEEELADADSIHTETEDDDEYDEEEEFEEGEREEVEVASDFESDSSHVITPFRSPTATFKSAQWNSSARSWSSNSNDTMSTRVRARKRTSTATHGSNLAKRTKLETSRTNGNAAATAVAGTPSKATSTSNDLLLREMRGMRADIRAWHESLQQFIAVQSDLAVSIKGLLKLRDSRSCGREH